MKAIKSINELQSAFSSQNSRWQEIIYDETGALLLFLKSGPALFSNCGYIDLDIDAEYIGINDGDKTEYCSITSIGEMTDYILKMPSYKDYLVDCTYGKFSKSELFWGIYARVINAHQNLALSRVPGNTVYGLYTIRTHQNEIELNMAVVEYDMVCYGLPLNKNLSLDEMLGMLVEQMNETAMDLGEPIYENRKENPVVVPASYEELLKKLEPNAEFGWLI